MFKIIIISLIIFIVLILIYEFYKNPKFLKEIFKKAPLKEKQVADIDEIPDQANLYMKPKPTYNYDEETPQEEVAVEEKEEETAQENKQDDFKLSEGDNFFEGIDASDLETSEAVNYDDLVDEINSASPEMKTLILSNFLDRKED